MFGEARSSEHTSTSGSGSMKKPFSVTSGSKSSSAKLSSGSSGSLRKLSSGFSSSGVPPSKKSKMSASSAISGSGMSHKDVTLAEAGKYGSLSEYAFFDKVCAKKLLACCCVATAFRAIYRILE